MYSFGHRVVTPRKISLAGSRDTARAAAVAPVPAATASSATPSPAVAAAAEGGGGLSAESSAVSVSSILGSSPSSSSGWAGSSAPSSSSMMAAAAASGAVAVTGGAAAEVKFHRDQVDVSRPVAVAIAAGVAHTSCLTRTGVVLTWCSQQLQPEVQVCVLVLLVPQLPYAVIHLSTPLTVEHVRSVRGPYVWRDAGCSLWHYALVVLVRTS